MGPRDSSFTSVRVCKPAINKERNSIVYVSCLEFRGRDFMEPWLEVMRKYFGLILPTKAIFPRTNITRNFLKQLYECVIMLKNSRLR